MDAKKFRWAKTYEAGESELISLLDAKNTPTTRWTGEEFQTYPALMHDQDIRIWCAEGSIAYTVNSKVFPLQAGDALDITAYTVYEATAGFAGCICYESVHGPALPPAV